MQAGMRARSGARERHTIRYCMDDPCPRIQVRLYITITDGLRTYAAWLPSTAAIQCGTCALVVLDVRVVLDVLIIFIVRAVLEILAVVLVAILEVLDDLVVVVDRRG